MAKSPWEIFGAKVHPLLISMEEWNNNDEISIIYPNDAIRYYTLRVWYTTSLGKKTFQALSGVQIKSLKELLKIIYTT